MAAIRSDKTPSGETSELLGENEVAESIKLTMKALKEYLGLKSSSEKEKLRFIGSELGRIASRQIAPSSNIEEALEGISGFWNGKGLGEMEVIQGTPLTFTIRNCFDCIAAQAGDTLCGFKEGFINAVLRENLTGRATVEETECCGTGSSTCRFTVTQLA